MRIDGYIRVSRVGGREGDSFISPDLQREKIEAWARLRGVDISRWETDLDQPGGKLDRPGLNAIMHRIRSGQTDGIAVARLDRLSRIGVAGALALIEEIHEHGATLAAVDLGIDPATEFGEFGMTIMLALARMERRRIKRSWEESREKANRRGVYKATPPFGYSRDEGGRLLPDEFASYVVEMFERKARAETLASIARWLNDDGVPTPSSMGSSRRPSAKQWIRSTVQGILRNEAYLGIAKDGEFVNATAHDALVDRDLFRAAQGEAIMPSQSVHPPKLLTGLLRCAGCGHTMAGTYWTRQGRKRAGFFCRRKHGAGDCPSPATILSARIEPWVVEQFFAYIENPVLHPTVETTDFAALTARWKRAQDELEAFVSDLEAQDIMGREAWLVGVSSRRDAVVLARQGMDVARVEATGVDPPPVADLQMWWNSLPVGSKRRYLKVAIDAVMIQTVGGRTTVPVEDRSRILWRGQAPVDLPRRGRTNVIRPFEFAPDFPPAETGTPKALGT